MAKIFTDITSLSEVVGGGINNSIGIEEIEPTIDNSARKYMIPWIGAVYTALKNKAEVDYTSEDHALLPYIKRALGSFTMFEYVAIGSVQFSGAGLVRTESENVKAAYKYQENNYKDSMLENGYESLEELILFLEENSVDYPEWTGNLREKSRALFINTAAVFREKYSSHVTRRTFEVLRPIIEDLEEFAILPIIGEEIFSDLKEGIILQNLTQYQEKALHFIQKALTTFAIREGLKRFIIRQEGEKIIYNERSESQSGEYQRIATKDQLEILAKSEAITGNRYISRLISYLDKNADEFNGWPLEVSEDDTEIYSTTNNSGSIINF